MFFTGGRETQPLYPKYESVRQALVKDSLPDAKTRAKSSPKQRAKNDRDAIAAQADAVSKTTDLEAARHVSRNSPKR